MRKSMRFFSTKNCTAFILAVIVIIIVMAQPPDCHSAYAQENDIREWHIAQDGTGDFAAIQEGVDYARDGDTLIIHPGIYNEKVSVSGKAIFLMGVDRDACIIQNDTSGYRNATLSIAAGGVSNLTIIGASAGMEPLPSINEPPAPADSGFDEIPDRYSGYAVHVEQNFLFQKEIRFSNCTILSQNNYCAGLGSRGGSTILFEGCELTAAGSGGCILLHDSAIDEFCGESDLIIRNCRMKCLLSPYIMAFQSYKPANRLNLTFQNVKASAAAYSDDTIYNAGNLNTYYTVEELARFGKPDGLHDNGGTAPIETGLVHILGRDESARYLSRLTAILNTDDYRSLMELEPPEGIVYIDMADNGICALKHQVINVENYSGKPEDGWCGLGNARLTRDSGGNTLPEMNAVPR